MEHDRLIDLMRALSPAPETWVTRAQAIPLLSPAERGNADAAPEGADAEADDVLAPEAEPWDPVDDHQADTPFPEDPDGGGWS